MTTRHLPEPLTRAAVLDGLHGRRVGTTVFAVEARTARLALHASQVCAPAICEDAVEMREAAILSAVADGRGLDRPPSIRDLERFAPRWASLVAPSAPMRASIAQRFGDQHRFRRADVPRLREALHLDDPDVADAFRERTGLPIGSLYADRLPVADRLRWMGQRWSARLEQLPPALAAFSLTLTQTVGAGILALPIALARIGPLAGVAVLVAIGLVNLLTIASIAETFTRTGEVRWSGAWFGGVVRTYLGPIVANVVTAALAVLSSFLLVAYYLGFGATLGDATPLPPAVWVTVLAAVGGVVVHRRRVRGTVTSSLVIGTVNVAAIVALTAVALTDFDSDRLTTGIAPGAGGVLDADVIGLVFGVVLLSYFGHTSIGSCARLVLDRDPGGRSLVRGVAAAMACAAVLYTIWVVGVGAGIDADVLASETSTALSPLADRHGIAVVAIGSVLAIGSMGMASVQFSMGLGDLVRERLGVTPTGIVAVAPLTPVIVAAAIAQYLLASERGSFAGPLGFVGALAVPALAGVIPVLLVVAARQMGDHVPDVAPSRWRGTLPLTVAGSVFLVALVAHAVVIWRSWPERAAAAGVFALCVVLVVRTLASPTLREPTMVVQVRHDRDTGVHTLEVTHSGSRWSGDTDVVDRSGRTTVTALAGVGRLPSRVASVRLAVPAGVRRLRLWHHSVDVLGTSQPRATSARLAGVPIPTDRGGAAVDVGTLVGRAPSTEPLLLELDLTFVGGER